MKAMVITDFGSPEVFAERDVEKPTPAKNEVLVKVYATSVNPADTGVRRGLFGPRIKLPAILGYDACGVVEEVGADVKDFQVGNEVYYAISLMEGNGANAEYHVANQAIVAKKPGNLSHLEAAAVPVAGGTAWAALIDRANIKVGETVVIHGGAGGVGSFAVQIAKAAGAYVYTTCGSYDFDRRGGGAGSREQGEQSLSWSREAERNMGIKPRPSRALWIGWSTSSFQSSPPLPAPCSPASGVDLVKSIGADRAIDYRNENFIDIIMKETGGAGVDVALTTVGGEVLAQSLVAIKAEGRAVTVTGVQGDLNLATFKNITIHFVHLENARPKLEALKTLIERGQIKPVVGITLPLNQVAEAHKKLEQGSEDVKGKIVLQVT